MIKNIITIFICLLAYSCNSASDAPFTLNPNAPAEIGIESMTKNANNKMIINVYMINHRPVSGIQFEITPNHFFKVDSVFGGRSQENDFALYSNKKGRVLGFSMKGNHIPESTSSNKKKNILFTAIATPLKALDTLLTISPIVADSDAKKMNFVSIPFELIGK